jgi:hypothetical protein
VGDEVICVKEWWLIFSTTTDAAFIQVVDSPEVGVPIPLICRYVTTICLRAKLSFAHFMDT